MTFIIGSLDGLFVCIGECFIDSSEPYFFQRFHLFFSFVMSAYCSRTQVM